MQRGESETERGGNRAVANGLGEGSNLFQRRVEAHRRPAQRLGGIGPASVSLFNIVIITRRCGDDTTVCLLARSLRASRQTAT